MRRDLVVGIDSSTSATKAIAWDRDGAPIAEGRAAIALSTPQPGHFEQDPAEWWSSTATALAELTRQVDARRIAGLAISNQRETFAFFDEAGNALAPGTVWLDERARAQQIAFGESFGAERVHAISGKPLDIIPCLYRMIWFREHHPDLFAAARRIADVHGALVFHLTGRWATSTASADPMGILDMARMDWSGAILDAAGVPVSLMPELHRPGIPIGTVTAAAAAATGLIEGTPVFAGGGDGQCAGTGVAVTQPGRAYVNLGTAVVSGIYGEAYAHDPAFRTMNAISETGFIFETCLRSGTFLIDWALRAFFGCEPGEDGRRRAALIETLEREAAASPIGAGGMMILPYWQGVMTPHWDSFARGIIAGLSGSTTRGDLYRALLESIALYQADVTNRVVAATGAPIDHYVAIGGGAASDLWLQILADATGRTVHRSLTVEASSLGAAMAAASGAGWFPTITEASLAMAARPVHRFEPDPERAAHYRDLLAIQAELWPHIARWNRKLVDFSEKVRG